jgi:2-oxoisovalerate dehydrogenase E2 component (dihydrolipoyl transacylase)
LCEVITDKLVAKIPSSYPGKIVKLHYKNDEIAQVGSPLLDMEVGDDVHVKEEVKKEEDHPAPAAAAPPKQEEKSK